MGHPIRIKEIDEPEEEYKQTTVVNNSSLKLKLKKEEFIIVIPT